MNPSDPTGTDIWHLHRLNIEDKHHGLLLAPLHVTHIDLVATAGGRIPGIMQRDRLTDDGAKFVFVPNRFDVNVHGEMTLLVCLGNGLPGERSPVVRKMGALLRLVRDDICESLFPHL